MAHDLLATAREVRRLAEVDPPGPPRANAATIAPSPRRSGKTASDTRDTGADASPSQRRARRAVPPGDLDATLVVYRRVRSQFEPVNCEVSDRRSWAGFQFRPVRNGIYLIRVGQWAGSVAGRYQLGAFAPVPPPSPPGPALRPDGVIRTLDLLQDTSDAWS